MTDPITGKTSEKTTKEVFPGFETSWLDKNGIMDQLLSKTHADIMPMTVPNVTVVPALFHIGQKVGPLPFHVVLPDGTDVTQKLESWTLPDTVSGAGKNGRHQFPPGTVVSLMNVLGAFSATGRCRTLHTFDTRMSNAAFTEDDVMRSDSFPPSSSAPTTSTM